MSTTRRQFLDKLAASSLALGAMPLALDAMGREGVVGPATQQGPYDDSWGAKLTGRIKAIFDVPEIEDGWGVYRAVAWSRTHQATLGTPARDISSVLVLRHHGIHLAMQQTYWDKYGINKANKVMHPLTGGESTKNPALLGVAEGMPERFGRLTLADFSAAGGVILACALAFEFYVVGMMAAADKISEQDAWTRARSLLAPNVILQPTGVYAVLRAQERGAMYIRAS